MQDLARVRGVLLAKVGAVEERPFGPDALVYKVMGKMFALVADGLNPLHLTLKCDPDEAQFLRDIYPAVRPGYHMNKQHWNTITLDGSVPEPELRQMIAQSYALVVRGLKKAEREALAAMGKCGM